MEVEEKEKEKEEEKGEPADKDSDKEKESKEGDDKKGETLQETETWEEIVRVPTAQGKQGKWPKQIPCQGKHREFGNFTKTQGSWKFCQNTGKTQGILFAQVINSLFLKVKDTAIFAAKISIFSRKLNRSAKSVLSM